MLTPEENKVLCYLQEHACAATAKVISACLPRATPEWMERIVANLDWLGYVTVYHDGDGLPAFLQITTKGRNHSSLALVGKSS